MWVASWLLHHGHSVTEVDAEQKSALHWAVVSPNPIPLIDLLVAAGADVNAADAIGDTPLHIVARKQGYREVGDALVRLGADPHRLNKNGKPTGHPRVV